MTFARLSFTFVVHDLCYQPPRFKLELPAERSAPLEDGSSGQARR